MVESLVVNHQSRLANELLAMNTLCQQSDAEQSSSQDRIDVQPNEAFQILLLMVRRFWLSLRDIQPASG